MAIPITSVLFSLSMNTETLLALVLLVLATLFAFHFARRKPLPRTRSTSASLPDEFANDLEEFKVHLGLCDKGYTWPCSNERPGDTVPFEGRKYKLESKVAAGSVWCWRLVSTAADDVDPPTTYVFVIRGSQTLQDWFIHDVKLAIESSGNTNECFSFQHAVEERLGQVALIADSIAEQMPPECCPNIILTGHSLGASIAEALFVSCKWLKKHPDKRTNGLDFVDHFCFQRCITFDSPGQPTSYRKKYMHGDCVGSIDDIMTLNAVSNLVNTLNQPCAKTFYACDKGNSTHLSDFVSSVLHILNLPILLYSNYVAQMISCNTSTHLVSSLKANLDDKNITKFLPASWPTSSQTVLKCIKWTVNVGSLLSFSTTRPPAVPTVLPATLPTSPRRQPTNPAPETGVGHQNSPPPPEYLIPVDGELQEHRVYCTDAITAPNTDWRQQLQRVLANYEGTEPGTPHAIVLLLVGTSGAGKTLLFLSLVEYFATKASKSCAEAISMLFGQTGTSTNNSQSFIVANLMRHQSENGEQYHVILIDCPGFGAQRDLIRASVSSSSRSEGNRNLDWLTDFEGVLRAFPTGISAVFPVVQGAILDDMMVQTHRLLQLLSRDQATSALERVNIVLSTRQQAPRDREQERQNLKERLMNQFDRGIMNVTLVRPASKGLRDLLPSTWENEHYITEMTTLIESMVRQSAPELAERANLEVSTPVTRSPIVQITAMASYVIFSSVAGAGTWSWLLGGFIPALSSPVLIVMAPPAAVAAGVACGTALYFEKRSKERDPSASA